jgi:hypothetical protein
MIPVVGRPKPFYGAVGNAVKLEAHAEPTQVTLDEQILYTITISGLIHPANVTRPDLQEDEGFRTAFAITDEPTNVPEPLGTRIFRYRLRSHRQHTTFIPGYTLHYFAPNAPRPFRTTRAESIPIVVTASQAPPPPPIVPLVVPRFTEQLHTDSEPPFAMDVWWGVVWGVPLVLCAGCVVWHMSNPTSFRAARRRRHRAARQALKRLRHLTPIDTDELALLMANYLALRFHCPRPPRTPTEVSEQLRAVGVASETCSTIAGFFHELDARRFAPPAKEQHTDLLQQAVAIIEAEEATR